uniref:Uncharacterized protein n=1 Tax=Megaselia scalaris TaxID=36166 RepID=T1GGL0_MEGSC
MAIKADKQLALNFNEGVLLQTIEKVQAATAGNNCTKIQVFPFIALENGGGAFVIPYIIALLIALCQFSRKGSVQIYERHWIWTNIYHNCSDNVLCHNYGFGFNILCSFFQLSTSMDLLQG